MGYLGNFMNALGCGVSAFRERLLNASPRSGRSRIDVGDWDRWEARCLRYDLYWSLYDNDAYADLVHPWAAGHKTAYGLYKHTRGLYNPAYRVGEFWASHLMGGELDDLAGDGVARPSALPILTRHDAVRRGLGELWQASNWKVEKDCWTRWGAVLADAPLKVVDDAEGRRMRIQKVHPGHLKWVEFDPYRNIRSYILQRWEYDPRIVEIRDASPEVDPRSTIPGVRYTEKCYRTDGGVAFETFLNGEPFAWDGHAARWEEPFKFVPMVIAGHQPIGLDWAQNAFHGGLSRFREVDDQASGLSDQIRKAIRAPMLLTGVQAKASIPRGGADRADRPERRNAADPEPERTELDFLYGSDKAGATHLTFPLDIAGVIAHIAGLNGDIDKNFPELLADTGTLSGAITATAMRMLRQRATAKVRTKRVGYDDALVKAQRMALAIGGRKGYEGYAGLGVPAEGPLDHMGDALDHSIGDRPVFDVDPLDAIEEDSAFWTAAGLAVKAGVPLKVYLRRNGWSEQDLAGLDDGPAVEG